MSFYEGGLDRYIILEFLETYQYFRCLWDSSDPEYMNKDLRSEAYGELLQIFRKVAPNATLETMRRKLENMRTAYKREAKKVQDSKRNGDESNNVYVPRLWYFKSLEFLDEKDSKLRSNRDILSGEKIDEAESRLSDISEPYKRPIKRILTKRQELPEKTAVILRTEDPWDIIGKGIGLELKGIKDEFQRTIAKKLISDVIFNANLNRLNPETTLQIPVSYQPEDGPLLDASSSSTPI